MQVQVGGCGGAGRWVCMADGYFPILIVKSNLTAVASLNWERSGRYKSPSVRSLPLPQLQQVHLVHNLLIRKVDSTSYRNVNATSARYLQLSFRSPVLQAKVDLYGSGTSSWPRISCRKYF